MPHTRSFRASAAAALLAATILAVSVVSCRPAVDPTPPGPATRLAIAIQPGDLNVGALFGAPPVVDVTDRNGAPITGTGLTVRAAISAGNAQISTGGEATVANGAATFSNLTLVGVAGSSIKLTFTLYDAGVPSTDATPVVTDAFTLKPGAPASVRAGSTAAIAGSPGTLVDPAPAVVVTDVGGNNLSGIPVTFAITQGEGRVDGAVQATTDSSGVATVSGWVLGLPGTNQLVASVSPTLQVTFTANVTTTTGMLRIRLSGQPAGVTANVRVTKTSVSGVVYDVVQSVRDSLTVTNLPFGTYQVTGDSVNVGTRIWQEDANFGGLNVAATSGPSVTLAYREYGRVEVTTRGLPGPTQTATLDFQPTGGASALLFAFTVVNDAITRGLGPIGTYNAVPRVVTVNGQLYNATPTQTSVGIAGGDSIVRMTFNYAVTTGTLTVTLAGTLPAGAAPQVDVTGPGGFHQTVFMSTTRSWTGLVPGSYTVVASPITVSGATFKPTPVTSPATVTAGVETTVTVTYGQ